MSSPVGWALLLVLAGCGRVGFSPISDALMADAVDAPPPPSGLVLWFQFDTDNGQTFVDSISGLTGSCSTGACPLVTQGHRGNAYDFDGNNDCILVPNAPPLTLTTFTISLWLSEGTSGMRGMFTKQLAGQNNSWQVSATNNDGFMLLYNAGAQDIGTPSLANEITFNTFQHLAATVDPTAIHVYVNTTEIINTVPTGTIVYDTGPAAIGCTAHSTLTAFFDGILDEIQIYNRVLAPNEIAQLASQ